jgi:peptidoglycan/xylan/chitin deacetylase (PgdA/CDA1 family)
VGNADHPRVAAVLDHLRTTYADVLAEHLPRFRPLRTQEAAELAADPWIRLGAHGHDHAILTYLDDAALDANLQEPRRRLAALGAGPVVDLAYPNGDTDARVAGRAAAAGYRRAWTTAPGRVDAAADPFHLGRILVGGFDPPWLLRFQINRLLSGRGQ